jgi:hypothetical protein
MNGFPFGIRMNKDFADLIFDRRGFFWRRKEIPEFLMAKVLEFQQKAIDGDKEAVQEAYFLLENIRKSYPVTNRVDAYYGCILTLQGRDALDPIERLGKVRQGLKFLDDAVQNEPDNVEIRILRGYVCYHLPEVFFHRTAMAVEDFEYLVTRFENEPDIFSNEFFRQVLLDLISAYKTLGRDQKIQAVQEKLQTIRES